MIVTRESDPREIDQLRGLFGDPVRGAVDTAEWGAVLGSLRPGEAALLPVTGKMAGAPAPLLEGHLGRGDFSRWISDVFGDRFLASQVAHVEELHWLGEMPDVSDALATLIRERHEIVRAGSGEAAVEPQNAAGRT